MKLSSAFAGAALALTVSATAAHADVIDFSGSNVNMNAVHVGQSGTITNLYQTLFTLPPNVVGSGNIFGFLPSNSMITFSYTFTGLVDGVLEGNTNYSYNNGNLFEGSAYANSQTGFAGSQGFINGVSSAPLAFAAANLNVVNPGTSTGTVRFWNTSDAFSQFSSLFSGLLTASPRGVGSATYAVSSIPLPAALP
ncbi:MAG: hypothetical protein K2Q01_09890, partial [Rickettsiales bacterium]|nr:hypothetical protein [Rickettsiales bacterium]